MKISDFKKIPLEKLTKTPSQDGEYRLITNAYWAITDDGCALKYRGYSIQCNKHKNIVESIASQDSHPATKVMFIERAWLKI